MEEAAEEEPVEDEEIQELEDFRALLEVKSILNNYFIFESLIKDCLIIKGAPTAPPCSSCGCG